MTSLTFSPTQPCGSGNEAVKIGNECLCKPVTGLPNLSIRQDSCNETELVTAVNRYCLYGKMDPSTGRCVCAKKYTGSRCHQCVQGLVMPFCVPVRERHANIANITYNTYITTNNSNQSTTPVRFRSMYGGFSLLFVFLTLLIIIQYYFRRRLPVPRYHVTIPGTPTQRLGGARRVRPPSSDLWAALHRRNMQIYERYARSFPRFQDYFYDYHTYGDVEHNGENRGAQAHRRCSADSGSVGPTYCDTPPPAYDLVTVQPPPYDAVVQRMC